MILVQLNNSDVMHTVSKLIIQQRDKGKVVPVLN
jgi:hypothetical protein